MRPRCVRAAFPVLASRGDRGPGRVPMTTCVNCPARAGCAGSYGLLTTALSSPDSPPEPGAE